jgi:hypothetical protein
LNHKAKVRSGARNSLDILQGLSRARTAAFGAPRASRTVGEIAWQPAQSDAIQIDGSRTVWNAGHVTSLLTGDLDVIAASQTGGVWLLHQITSPSPLAGYTGSPLSESWDTPDVSCLAWGSQPGQVFAGTESQAMFLLEFEPAGAGHLTAKQSTPIHVPFTIADAIVILTNLPES